MKRIGSILSLFWAFLAANPVPVDADGIFVWKNEEIDILEPEQKALIFFNEGQEDLVLSVKFEGAPGEFGWIVPLPAVPEIFPEDIALFERLSQATQERQYERSNRGRFVRSHTLSMSEDVTVLKSQTVGIYEAKVLGSRDGSALSEWLQANGFRLPSGADRVLGRYIDEGWVFVALKILPGEEDSFAAGTLASGTLQPVRFRFPCREPVFPLEISSLGRSESEVLLYVLQPEIQVPRSPQPEAWENHIYSRSGGHHWIYQYEQDEETTEFLPHYEDPFFLTKHRIHLAPREMEDVYFTPYDPATGLRGENTNERLDALAYLGIHRPEKAEDILLEFLPGARSGKETLSTLWALGEVLSKRSEKALLERIEDPNPAVRIEVIEALGKIGSRAAIPHYLRGLEVRDEPGDGESGFAETVVQRACFDNLLKQADESLRPMLKGLSSRDSGMQRWKESAFNRGRSLSDFGSGIDPGVLAVAAGVACGDTDAMAVIIDAIVQGAEVTRPAALREAAASRRGSINGFPAGFWTGMSVLSKVHWSRVWSALNWTCDLYEARPDLRDEILRRAMQDARLTETGAMILMARLEEINEAEIARLLEIWDRSTRDPIQTIEITNPGIRRFNRHQPASKLDIMSPTIVYNYDACAVAYCLAMHDSVEELLEIWQKCPPDDNVLRGEIIHAMVLCGDSRFRPAVLEYVRDVWGTRSRSADFESALLQQVERRTRLYSWSYELESAPFDFRYRSRQIRGYLFGHP